MRAIMIFFGVMVAEKFKIVTLIFAIILLVSSFKMFHDNSNDDDDDLDNNYILVISKKFLRTTSIYDGDRFFTIIDGVNVATPLLLCLICVELSDVIFAIDSVPAVLGVSHDPIIVYSSNIFAIMGLRALYTILATAISDFVFLKPAVAFILFFVGIKMILEYFNYQISTGFSILVIGILLSGGMILSLLSKSTTSSLRKYLKSSKGTDKKSKHSV